jgi:hypothetical protein
MLVRSVGVAGVLEVAARDGTPGMLALIAELHEEPDASQNQKWSLDRRTFEALDSLHATVFRDYEAEL